MHLTDDQKKIGKQNYENALGTSTTRRDFFKELTVGGLVAGTGLGAAYFGYGKVLGADPLRVGIIGTGDEGNILIGALNPDFVDVKAIADIRPSSVHRAFHGDWSSDGTKRVRPGLMEIYGWKTEAAARENVKVYEESYQELLDDDDIEAVIIALPLWLHHQAAIDAMRAGKHVLTEKLMAHNVAQCKEMARVAYETGMLLATGHQRHYSVLYDNAVDTIRRGLIGDIHHIRAQWHRNNVPGNDSWQPALPVPMMPEGDYLNLRRAARPDGKEGALRAEYKLLEDYYSYSKRLANQDKPLKGTDREKVAQRLALVEKRLADNNVNAASYGYIDRTLDSGYHCSPLEELIRWRLWDRTGGGLMAELGSHQLDASGIFIASQFEGNQKVNPLSVTAVGGRHIFPQDRDVDDHVYCSFEYPGRGYFEDNDPKKGGVADANKKVVVTYSSINGNDYGGYGEVVMGTKGTLILEREQETYLFSAKGANTSVKVEEEVLVDSYETGGGYAEIVSAPKQVSRGYREEIEHWAWCIRNDEPITTLHCHPKVALADAVIALTSNIAMRQQQRIDFDPAWFDPDSDETPEGSAPRAASEIKRSSSAGGPVA